MFQCWFNTFFVKEEECSIVQNGAGPTGPRYKYLTLSMNKHELDKANKDKQSKIYNRDFMVRIFNICLTLCFMIIIFKYNILERVLVENIIWRNVIINRGAAKVDNHILRDYFRLAPSQECYIYFILPNIIPLFINHVARSSKDNAMRNCYK